MDTLERLEALLENYQTLVEERRKRIEQLEEDNKRLREALEYCACTCAKSCGKHIEHDGEIAFVECSGWVARSALQQKETE